jgi:hypothetical protein
MHRRRRLAASVGFVAAMVGSLSVASVAPAGAAPKPRVSVEVADTATRGGDGQTVVVVVTASCAPQWQVLEALVTISQPQATGMGGIPLSCTGRPQTFTVTVTSFGLAFEPGDARASAFVLIERRGQTQQAQDSEVIQLV